MEKSEVHNLIFDPQKLRDARIAKFGDRSARRVAIELLKISPQSLSKYEKGDDKPSPTTLAQMCALYGVDLLELTSLEMAT
jgi:hypothetical protein